MENIVKIDELTYKNNNRVIINNLSLNIEKNTWVSVIGPNGSGKTTLIKILSCLLPYEGYVNIDNLVIDERNKEEITRKLGIVLDNIDNQLIGLTVEDNLAFPLENLNYTQTEIKEKITKIAKRFKLNHILKENIKNITNSEKQLVSIASALIINPKVLLLDDCLHQLEPKTKKELLNNLKSYRKEYKLTIIMTTQNLEDTLCSDKIVLINKGKLIAYKTPLAILKDDELLKNNALKQPFIIELSQKLMLYDLVEHIYLDERKLVKDLWK